MKRKKRGSVIGAFVLALMTAVTFGLPDSSFAGTQSNPTADDVQYYTVTKDGKEVKTGIKSIVIDPNTYTNISRDPDINGAADDSGKVPTITLNDATMEKIVKKYVFPRWGVVAEGIFRDQADQLVTIEGTGMMDSLVTKSESFDRHFSYSRDGVVDTYKKYDWALSDLASTLGTPPSKSGKKDSEMGEFKVLQGKANEDEVVYSGIYPIKNLSEARTLMGKGLRACSDDDNLTVDDFLGNDKDKAKKEYRLPAIADDKTGKGFASIVTCVNRAGDSWDYDYNTFGIAVYDIDVTPIAANNLNYITAAQEYIGQENPLEAAYKAGVKGTYYDSQKRSARLNRITNKAPQASTNTVSLAHNVSEQISATTQDTFTFGMDQQIGVEGRIGANNDPYGLVIKFSTTFRETWASMKSNGKSHTEQENRTITSQVSLPGHTAASIDQNIEEITQQEDYQQPVVINYKVAIFGMSGDYFNGSLGVGMINPGRYDKEWMSVIFDGSDADEQNGCKALSSLYNRAVTNYGVAGYDGVHGKYRTWCDKGAWVEANKIDWEQIAIDIRNDKRSSHILSDDGKTSAAGRNVIHDMASNLQFAETAATISTDSNAMLTSIGEIVPLYDLKSVAVAKGNKVYDVKSGQGNQSIYLDSIELKGYDSEEVEFYGFNKVKGKWQIKEKNPEDTSCFTLRDDSVLGQVVDVTPNTESSAECTLEWVPDQNQTIASAEESPNGMSEDEIAEIERPQIKVRAIGGTTAVDKVKLTGEYIGPYDAENINLNKVLNVNVTDSENKALSVPIYWESDGSKGIKVSENGDVSFTVPGFYRVRAYCRDNDGVKTSDWTVITAAAKAELHSMELATEGLDEEALTLNENNKTRTYDLNSLVAFKDQFGKAWEGTDEEPLPSATFSLDTQDKSAARIDSAGFLTVNKAGTYKVTAQATDENNHTFSDTATLRITAQPWLSEIEFNQPAVGRNDLKLNAPGDQIKIGGLKNLLEYYDQNENEWTGSKPKVSFRIAEETEGAQIVAGGDYTFYAYEPGRYTIQPEIAGFDVDPVHIDVTANKDLVINVAAPSRQILTGDEPIELELERFLTGTTAFGETWKGDLPEMFFELDSGVEGASIKTETIKDSRTGESVEIHKFISDTAGEYAIHVTPKQASAYKGDIDDIIINVVAYDKITRLGLSEITEETTGKSLTVNTYKDQYPVIALEGFVEYYDQNGNPADRNKPNVVIPDVAYELVQYDDQGKAKEVDESDAVIKDGVLTIYTGGVYMVRVGVPKNLNIVQAEATVIAPDITWMHDFGDWEVTEPTCTEDGKRVKTCQDENCPICKKEGEGYHETITDTIPATGHHWDNVHQYYTTETGARYVAIKCLTCGEIRPGTKINLANSQYIDSGNTNPDYNTTPATCEEDGRLVLRNNTMGGTERTYYNIPATGHYWTKDYVTDEAHTASCDQKGSEWLECQDCGTVKPDSEKAVPQLAHNYPVNEASGDYDWETEVAPTCDRDGYKEVKCTHCGDALRHIVPATGHTWDETKYVSDPEHAATCSKEGIQWHECTVCHAPKAGSEIPIPKIEHTYPKNPDTGEIEWETKVAPTCEEAGYNEVKCEVCEEPYRVELPASGHSITHVSAKAATCEEDGCIEHWTCSVCGAFFKDDKGKTKITEADTVLPATGHTLKHVEAKDATCEQAGNIEHWTCSVCGAFFKDKDGQEKITETDVVIPATRHDIELVEEQDADCQHEGVEAHYKCKTCGQLFADEEGKNKVSMEELIIPVNGDRHTNTDRRQENTKAATCTTIGGYDTVVYCEDCEAVISRTHTTLPKLNHKWGEWTVTKEATETKEGEEQRICENDPSHVETRVIPVVGHEHGLSKVDAKEATCEKTGNVEYYVCDHGNSPCGRYFKDAAGTEELTTDEITVDATGHTRGTEKKENLIPATCTTPATYEGTVYCTVCGKELSREKKTEGSALGHKYGDWENLDAEQHQRVCVHDSTHIEKADHVWNDGEVTTPATCTAEGVKTYTCGICGATRTESIPQTDHDWGEWKEVKASTCVKQGQEVRECKHNSDHKEYRYKALLLHDMTRTAPKAATCTKPGNIEYYTCSECGGVFSDGEGKFQIDLEDTVVPAKGHTWDAGKETKAATTTETGIMTYTCTVCQETKTEVIPKAAAGTGTKANTLNVKGKTVKVKYKKVKKKAKKFKVTKVIKFTNKGQGKLTYVKASGNKKITIAKKTGKVTVKKKLKKGTYKVKVKVQAAGNTDYMPAEKIVTVTVKVK